MKLAWLTRTRLWFLIILLALLLKAQPHAVAAQSGSAEHLAIILILDDSGSMETNDPTGLRYTGAQLFVSLLDEGDAAGALRFATTSTRITNGIEVITGPGQHTRLVESLAMMPPDGYTDVKAAFEEASRMQQAFDQAGYRMVVIFLTDGKPEIPAPIPTYEQEALDAARSLGAPVLSIALTSEGQTPFLNRLAVETGGSVIFARSASELLDTYLQILGDIKDRTVIGTGMIAAPGEATFTLDPALMPYVDRVSFVAGKPVSADAVLVSPGGQEVPVGDLGSTFAIQNRSFTVITVVQPVSGDWRFALSGSGNVQARAILYSRLRGRLVSPRYRFEAGQPLPIVLKLVEEQDGDSAGQKPVNLIGEASFAAWITRPDGTQDSLDQFYDDGTHGDVLAGDGLYTRLYVNTGQAGMYHLAFRGSKGAIPVVFQADLQGIAFPLPVLDQPLLPHYDIRDNTVPLKIHLDGAAINDLDQGSFTAAITTPGGAIELLSLECSSDMCSGAIQPTENGPYRVRIDAVDAVYQGLPYQHGLEIAFEARIIPTLLVKFTQVGLQAPVFGETQRFELLQAQQGIPLSVNLSSTSSHVETVTARIEGLPGFALLETDGLPIAANGETTLLLHLLADVGIPAQTSHVNLVFTASDGVDLIGGDIPIGLDLFEPLLSITPRVSSAVSSDSCLKWAPIHLTLHLNSNSIHSEQIKIHLEDLPGAALSLDTITVPPGESEVKLVIQSDTSSFAPGNYAGKLIVDGVRPGLKVIGGGSFPISFRVEPVWLTCRKPMIFSGVGLCTTLILIVSLIARARRNARPPIVTGTLIHWDPCTPDLTVDVNLTALHKMALKIGKGSQNDIVIADEAIQTEHALLLTERGENDELRLTLHPIAAIRKGYRVTTSDLPLEENVQYQMGSRIFKYIRDLE